MVPATLSSTSPILLSIQLSMTLVDPTFHTLLDILKILPFDLTSHIVGGITTHILKCSNFANLYLKNTD